MCGVIVVDADRSRSTCLEHDAYIHDHCLRYHHNYSLFYQLLNSNLFTHRMLSFKREASSEKCGPQVYLLSYYFQICKIKTPKIPCCNLFTFILFCTFFIFYIYHYQISSLQVTVKGLTTPLSRWVQVFVCLCRCYHWRLVCSSYWIDTLVLNWGKYLSLLCCITLPSSREKPTQAQEIAGRISGAVAREDLH